MYCTCDFWYLNSVIAPISGLGADISSTEENSTTRLSNSNVVWFARARARNRARNSTPAVLVWGGPLPPLPKRHVCSRINQRILSLLSFSWWGPIHNFTRFDITAPASPLHSDSPSTSSSAATPIATALRILNLFLWPSNTGRPPPTTNLLSDDLLNAGSVSHRCVFLFIAKDHERALCGYCLIIQGCVTLYETPCAHLSMHCILLFYWGCCFCTPNNLIPETVVDYE